MMRVGHRGASGYEPENTIISFRKAILLNVDFIELDVHLSKDKRVIVMHDASVDRTTNGSGQINDLTLNEIKKLRTKQKNQPIPTLEEVLAFVKGRAKIIIEIKDESCAFAVVKIVDRLKLYKKVVISSNFLQPLKNVKKRNGKIRTAFIRYSTGSLLRDYLYVLAAIFTKPFSSYKFISDSINANVDEMHLYHKLITASLVAKLHSLNMKVVAWTVNDQRNIKKLRELGVDAIISDYPDRI
jgi:glycerophosphoryl diester phosphodiesterase